jgi:hypothetical protein
MSNIYTAGLNNVGSYQVSGIPYLSGAIDASSGGASLTFPYVTRWITITNSGSADLLYGYSENGAAGSNVGIVLPNSTTPRLEVKVTELYMEGGTSGGVYVAAGLTNLPTDRVDNIAPSGSNWSGSVGVG